MESRTRAVAVISRFSSIRSCQSSATVGHAAYFHELQSFEVSLDLHRWRTSGIAVLWRLGVRRTTAGLPSMDVWWRLLP